MGIWNSFREFVGDRTVYTEDPNYIAFKKANPGASFADFVNRNAHHNSGGALNCDPTIPGCDGYEDLQYNNAVAEIEQQNVKDAAKASVMARLKKNGYI